ncbi:MAG: putative exopolyphosphatase [Verrucomicrobiales bacterium]|nr:putative exopolyphosphatase [Verrucomicrobiales bacterium]
MQPVRRAVIDIGTNSTKLLVADVAGRFVTPVWEESEQTRLGEGFYETHLLQREAIHATAYFVAQYARIAQSYKVVSTRVIATSAARDALNKDELLLAIEKASGMRVDVISGEKEAELAFRGVNSNPTYTGQRLCIMDLGGGSTEFIVGEGEQMEFAQSFKIGGLRLQELFRPSDPPTPAELQKCRAWLREFVRTEVQPVLSAPLAVDTARTTLVGTGSAASILARMHNRIKEPDRDILESTHLSLESVTQRVEDVWSLMLSDRKRLIGLPKKRADTILFSAAVYEAVMREFGFGHLRVSTRGLRYAAILD